MKCTIVGWIVGLMLAVMLIGSPPAAASGKSKTDLERKNITKLTEMSPEQISALDRQLAEALRYFYNEEFQRALPIFSEIADKVETMDLMFWIGTSAAKTGQYELSIEKYKRMLLVDPELYRVRLELAEVLQKTGRMQEARRELEIVKAASPPDIVMRKINQRLRTIEKKAEKVQWGFNLSTGYQYDDNASSGPDKSEIVIETGTLQLNSDQRQLEGYNWLAKFGGDVRYDIGETRGLMWSGKLDLYSSYNTSGNTELNYMATDISTGPLWVMQSTIFRLPVGYRNTQYGEVHLSDTLHVDPKLEVFLNRQIGLQIAYTYANESYSQAKYRGNDNTLMRVTIGPNIYLQDRKHVLSGNLSFENRDADRDSSSYETSALELSYFTRLPRGTEVFFKYKGSERVYEDNPPLFSGDRVDRRHTFSAAVSQRFSKRYFASLGYVYMDNESNAGLYSFTKNIVSLDVGIAF